MNRHKKVFQRLHTKRAALRHGWRHVVHGSETRRARRPVPKTRIQIPQMRCISVDVQEYNVRVTLKGRLTDFGASEMAAPRYIYIVTTCFYSIFTALFLFYFLTLAMVLYTLYTFNLFHASMTFRLTNASARNNNTIYPPVVISSA